MKKFIALITIIFCFSIAAAASAPQKLTVDNSGHTFKSMPLGNTWGNNILVFYDIYTNGIVKLKSRLVNSAGVPAAQTHIYVTDTEWAPWTAVWSPLSNSYLLVYAIGDKVYARPIRQDGVPTGGAKLIFGGFDSKNLFLAFTARKRFVLFFEQNGEVLAQVLKKNGARKGGVEVVANSDSGGSCLTTSVSTMNNGDTIVYYSHFDPNTLDTQIKMLRLNYKLQQQADYTLKNGLTAYSETDARNYKGVCDYGDDLHLIVYKMGTSKPYYALVKHDGTFVKKPKRTPIKDLFPRHVEFDSTSDVYRLFYSRLTWQGTKDIEKFYLTNIRDNGTFADRKKYITQTTYECDYRTFGVSRDGNLLITWSPEVIQALEAFFIKY